MLSPIKFSRKSSVQKTERFDHFGHKTLLQAESKTLGKIASDQLSLLEYVKQFYACKFFVPRFVWLNFMRPRTCTRQPVPVNHYTTNCINEGINRNQAVVSLRAPR
jgi:hypothetical protein